MKEQVKHRRVRTSKKQKQEESSPKIKTYEGEVNVGDFVWARFAGGTVYGEVIGIGEYHYEEGPCIRYTVKNQAGIKYPISRERIIGKNENK